MSNEKEVFDIFKDMRSKIFSKEFAEFISIALYIYQKKGKEKEILEQIMVLHNAINSEDGIIMIAFCFMLCYCLLRMGYKNRLLPILEELKKLGVFKNEWNMEN